MDMGEVLIITPCVGGVDLCARVGKRGERGGNNVPAPPPTAWICHKRLEKRKRKKHREEGEMFRDSVKQGGEED